MNWVPLAWSDGVTAVVWRPEETAQLIVAKTAADMPPEGVRGSSNVHCVPSPINQCLLASARCHLSGYPRYHAFGLVTVSTTAQIHTKRRTDSPSA